MTYGEMARRSGLALKAAGITLAYGLTSIAAQAQAGAFLASADMIVWAVKPQTFKDAAVAVAAHNTSALHLSVAAGIPSSSIAAWLGSERIIRTMPNTPALIGKGITALYALPAVTQAEKDWADEVIATTGASIRSSPAVANNIVYIGATDNKLYAIGGQGATAFSLHSALAASVPPGGSAAKLPATSLSSPARNMPRLDPGTIRSASSPLTLTNSCRR